MHDYVEKGFPDLPTHTEDDYLFALGAANQELDADYVDEEFAAPADAAFFLDIDKNVQEATREDTETEEMEAELEQVDNTQGSGGEEDSENEDDLMPVVDDLGEDNDSEDEENIGANPFLDIEAIESDSDGVSSGPEDFLAVAMEARPETEEDAALRLRGSLWPAQSGDMDDDPQSVKDDAYQQALLARDWATIYDNSHNVPREFNLPLT